MKTQALFSSKILKCRLLQFLFGALRVNSEQGRLIRLAQWTCLYTFCWITFTHLFHGLMWKDTLCVVTKDLHQPATLRSFITSLRVQSLRPQESKK